MKKRFSVFFIFLALSFFMSALFIGVKHKALADTQSISKKAEFILESKSAMLIDAHTKTPIITHNE